MSQNQQVSIVKITCSTYFKSKFASIKELGAYIQRHWQLSKAHEKINSSNIIKSYKDDCKECLVYVYGAISPKAVQSIRDYTDHLNQILGMQNAS